MKRYAVLCALLALSACNPPPLDDVAVSGPTERPERPQVVRITGIDGGPVVFPTTTTVPPTTTHTHPPTTTTTAPAVVPATTTPAVAYTPSSASCGGWGELVASLWPAEQVATSCRIMLCESNGNPRAYNPSGASGLYQIMPLWADDYERVTGLPYYDGRFDAYANAAFARWLWGQTSSWKHWSCKP
jgi:hypothetical protein